MYIPKVLHPQVIYQKLPDALVHQRPHPTIQTTVYDHPSSCLILQTIKQIPKTPFISTFPVHLTIIYTIKPLRFLKQLVEAVFRPHNTPPEKLQVSSCGRTFPSEGSATRPGPAAPPLLSVCVRLQRTRYGKIDVVRKKIPLITSF